MDIPLYDIVCQSHLEGTHFLRFGLISDQMERFGNAIHWCSFPPRAWIRRPNATMSGRWSTCTPLSQVRILVSVSPSSPAKIVWCMHLTEYHDYIVLMCM